MYRASKEVLTISVADVHVWIMSSPPTSRILPVPSRIGNADVIMWAIISDELRTTGSTKHLIGGQLEAEFTALAICRYPNENGCYLFYCNSDWEAVTDTFHARLEDALEQAEFEYEGIGTSWTRTNACR